MEIPGIHHVTAVAGDAQRNVDFYAGVLGMRLVKRTVNHDDPTVYHLYYGDAAGRPGSLLTFFARPGAPRGRLGTGMAAHVALRIPPDAAGYWADRLARRGIATARLNVRGRGEVIAFNDPDGLSVALVACPGRDGLPPWDGGPVPPRRAVRGIFGVTLLVKRAADTAAFLGMLGVRVRTGWGTRFRCVAGDGRPGTTIDVAELPVLPAGTVSAGSIHHVALRAPGDAAQEIWRDAIAAAGVAVTPVIDRTYFRSVYFREPGGALLEIATDGPGFAVDEPIGDLGSDLKFPESLAPAADRLRRRLPPLRLPRAA
ncbi:MAG: VOC family protein [Gemmatimonadota bacterium]